MDADVVIVGVGSVGSMAAWQLAARGLRVIGVDRYDVPGSLSAYTGETRVFRTVYAEGGHYTPLLRRAKQLWRELESSTRTELLQLVGAVTIINPDNPELQSLLSAGTDNDLDFEVLTAAQARARFPQHRVRDDDRAVVDPDGGYVRSEDAVNAAIRLARELGATFRSDCVVREVRQRGETFVVCTDDGDITAAKVLVSAGTGAGPVCATLGTKLAVLPQALTWFPAGDPSAYRSDRFPVFMRRGDDARFYGFPSLDGSTVKVAASVYMDEVPTMSTVVTWRTDDLQCARSWVESYLPGLTPEPARVAVCADGYLPDGTGMLGHVPGLPGLVVAVGFSGHGFKMCPALGAVAADLVAEGNTETPVDFMDPARFLPAGVRLDALPLSLEGSR